MQHIQVLVLTWLMMGQNNAGRYMDFLSESFESGAISEAVVHVVVSAGAILHVMRLYAGDTSDCSL